MKNVQVNFIDKLMNSHMVTLNISGKKIIKNIIEIRT